MKGEIIGKQIKAKTKSQMFVGVVVDETKNTIKIETKDKIKTIIKKEAIFKIDDNIVEGKKITKRPEDRIKAC